MQTREIILSASLMGIYLMLIFLGSMAPAQFTALMFSALFGLFWHYFSVKQNLFFQCLRFGYNMIRGIRSIPSLLGVLKAESVAVLWFYEWLDMKSSTPIDAAGIQILEIFGQANLTKGTWFFFIIYSLMGCFVIPYLFYRYFRLIKIYKRIPVF